MRAGRQIEYLAYRAGQRYRANRREVRGTAVAVIAVTVAALSFSLATGQTVLSAVIIALATFACGATTITVLMMGRAGRHQRRNVRPR